MKNIFMHYHIQLFKTLLFTLLSIVASGSFAHDFAVDGICYVITSDTDKTVAVSYYGNTYSYSSYKYKSDVNIPQTVTYNRATYNVTSIADFAFYNCPALTSVTIPYSVTSIGDNSFQKCTGLTSIIIPVSVTSIGERAFEECSGLTSVTIPYSVKSIGSYAFSGCIGLLSVVIPESIVSINNGTFQGCTSLTSVDIRGRVISIGSSAFYNCYCLTSLTIPQNVTSIGSSAFSGCRGLSSISIPKSVTSIGSSAFYDCRSLTKAEFASIESLCSISFSSSDSNPLYYAHHLYIDGKEVTDLVIPNGVTSIGSYAFYGCSGLISVIIPESVTSVGEDAFYGFNNVNALIIEEGDNPLELKFNLNYFKSISKFVLGRKLTKDIYLLSFVQRNKGSLTDVFLGENVTSIPEGLFKGCTILINITLSKNIAVIPEEAFSGCSSISEIKGVGELTSIGRNAFYGCEKLKSFYIPDGVKKLENGTFSGCNRLTEVRIGCGVEEIGDSVFYNCSLTRIYNYAEYPQKCGKGTFSIIKYYCKLFVKEDSQDIYRVHQDWSSFNIQLMDDEALPVIPVQEAFNRKDAYYDLSGRQLSKPIRGLYIQNGKRFFVR